MELLSPEKMRLLGSAKKKDKDGEDLPKLESAEDVLVQCNLVNNSYQKYCLLLYLINNSVGFWQNFNLLKCGLLIKIIDHLK